MYLIVRYYRPMVFGSYMTLTFNDIDIEETTVWQLKRKVSVRIRTQPHDQKMTIRNEDKVVEMENEVMLSSYLFEKCDCIQMVIHLQNVNES